MIAYLLSNFEIVLTLCNFVMPAQCCRVRVQRMKRMPIFSHPTVPVAFYLFISGYKYPYNKYFKLTYNIKLIKKRTNSHELRTSKIIVGDM